MAVETAMVLPIFLLGLIILISFMEFYSVQTVHLTKLCEKVKAAGMYAYVTGGGGPKEITLPDIYTYAPVGGLMSLPEIRQYNAVTVHTWTGREQGGLGEVSSAEAMVFVTESGSVYHRKPGCSYIRLSISQVAGHSVSSKRNQYGERYTACETCSQNGNPAGVVYITKSGDRYHNLASCSGLKRTVRMVKESEAKGMGACTRCG